MGIIVSSVGRIIPDAGRTLGCVSCVSLNRFFLSCRTCGSTLGTIADYFSRGHWLLSLRLVSRFKTCPAIRSVGIILKQLSIIPTLHSDIISDVTVMLSSHSDARLGLMKNDDKNVFFGNVSSFWGLF